MKVTPQQTEKLLLENHSFSQLGFSMMLTRLKGIYAANPSPVVLETSMNEINMFLDKFKGVLKNDYNLILKIQGGQNDIIDI